MNFISSVARLPLMKAAPRPIWCCDVRFVVTYMPQVVGAAESLELLPLGVVDLSRGTPGLPRPQKNDTPSAAASTKGATCSDRTLLGVAVFWDFRDGRNARTLRHVVADNRAPSRSLEENWQYNSPCPESVSSKTSVKHGLQGRF